MVFFDKEARMLRDRWRTIDTKDVNFAESPFGLTQEGLQDFRGYCVRGALGAEHIISKQRFEKCDLSFSRFADCKIVDSLFVGCKLYAVDFHSCQVLSTPKPNCTCELIVGYQPPALSPKYFEERVRQLAAGLDEGSLHVRRLDQIQLEDLDRVGVFCLSLRSAPSLESFDILCQILEQSENAPPLIVIDQDTMSNLSEPERQLTEILFNCEPSGLGEGAWLKQRKVIRSDVLAKTRMREAIALSLGLLGAGAGVAAKEMSEERFWEIVAMARPDMSPYSPQPHADRLCSVLKALSDNELRQFETFRKSLGHQVYTFDMATAASTIGTGCGDDSFADFRAALIYRGREVFYHALKTPEEALLKIDGAHHLLLEGFDYLANIEIKKRPGLPGASTKTSLPPGGPRIGLGGAAIEDEEKAYRKRFPKLFKKYWGKEEFRVSGALSIGSC